MEIKILNDDFIEYLGKSFLYYGYFKFKYIEKVLIDLIIESRKVRHEFGCDDFKGEVTKFNDRNSTLMEDIDFIPIKLDLALIPKYRD
jgi:hypothetical protein